jgi:hypothetical protein
MLSVLEIVNQVRTRSHAEQSEVRSIASTRGEHNTPVTTLPTPVR